MSAETLLDLGKVVGALGVLFGAMLAFVRTATKVAAPHFARAVEVALAPRLAPIEKELQNNGGGSVKDVTRANAANLSSLAGSIKDLVDEQHKFVTKQDEFITYQRNRNHDVLGALAGVSMLMKVLHKGDLEDIGFSSDDLEQLVVIKDRRENPREGD